MRYRGLGAIPLPRLLPVTVLGMIVAAVLVVLSHSAGAQGVDVQISELDCEGDPEVIVITNEGDQPVEMTGWNLQSDPPTDESLPLGVLGFLSPGESILVESGPSAEAAFTWSRDFVFRDDDPTDFAQLASDAGDVLLKVNCGSLQQPTATAAATPAQTAEPALTPTVLPADAVPVGGGPPAAGAGSISPAAMIVAGSWLLTAGLSAFAFPFLSRGSPSRELDPDPPAPPPGAQELPAHEPESPEPPAPADQLAPPSGGPVDPADARTTAMRAEDPLPAYLALVVIVLILVAVLVFLLQGGEKKRE